MERGRPCRGDRAHEPFTLHQLLAGVHNIFVLLLRCAIRILAATRSFVILASVAMTCFADLQASATAMACCARTDYTCASLSGPDDCCQHMGHGAPTVVAGTSANFRLVQSTAAVVSPGLIDATLSLVRSRDAVPAFKRPHDPPHLHAYSLLI
jgi:hypothetical protein